MKQKIYVDNNLFLGRIEEQKQFRSALLELTNQPSDDESPYVVLLFGDGGMGKTTLAKRFRDIAQSEQPFDGEYQLLWIDWEDERSRNVGLNVGRDRINPDTIFDVIHSLTIRKNLGAYFTEYQSIVKQRNEIEKKVNEVVNGSDRQDDLVELRGLTATMLARLVRTNIPLIGQTGENLAQAFMNVGIKVSAEEASRIQATLVSRVKTRLKPNQYEIFLNPSEQLARGLAHGLKKLSVKRPLIIFLDTYEVVDRVDSWIRLLIKSSGPRVLWVISGRNNLLRSRRFGKSPSDYIRGYAEEFSSHLLSYDMRQLALDDIRIYFHYRAPDRPLNEDEISLISQTTRGVPLAVCEAAEMWSKNVALVDIVGDGDANIPSNKIVQVMTDRYLIHAIPEADRRALFALALARGDVEILDAMLRPPDVKAFDLDTELRRLERDYASVHYELARLHEEPTLFFREYLKDDKRRTGDLVKHLIQQIIPVLQARISKLEECLVVTEQLYTDEDWVTLA